MSNTVTGSSTDRIFGLDVFRAIAILLVVLVHGGFLLDHTSLSGFPYFNMIDGVDLFFVLSGFLIGGILIRDMEAGPFGFSQLAHFWKRRWFRTFPNYYLILLANYLVVYYQVIHEDIGSFNWTFLVFSQNLYSPFMGFFWESWSLSVEEWFYLLAPLLLMLQLLVHPPKKSFLYVTLLMILFPLLRRIYFMDEALISGFGYDVTFRKVVLMRLDSIAYGLLAAWICYYYKAWWSTYKWLWFATGILLIVFILNYDSTGLLFYRQVMLFTMSPVAAALLLPLASSIRGEYGMFGKAVIHISKISYSMYLINLALVAEVIRDNFPPTGETDAILKYMYYWLIVIIGSTVLYRCFEKPMMNLRDKI